MKPTRTSRFRPSQRRRVLALLAGASLALAADAAAGDENPGRYTRRQRARGETTDTSARLSTYAFINDRREDPWRMTLFVDTFPARVAPAETLVALRVGVARAGRGRELADIPIAPERFLLSAPSFDAPLPGLRQAEILAHPAGRWTLREHARMGRLWPAPVPFGTGDGRRIGTLFNADPTQTVLIHDETELPPGTWLVDTLFFEVGKGPDSGPEDFDRWNELMTITLLGPDDEPLVGVDFRIERDPQRLRRAFKRARKAREREDREAEKQRRSAR